LTVFCTLIACDSQPSLIGQYLKNFKEIGGPRCTIIVVLPQYACTACTASTFNWLKSNNDNSYWVITDDLKYEGLPQVIIESDRDRMVQHNPFINKAYVSIFMDDVVIKTKPIGIEDLDDLGQIFLSLKQECGVSVL